MDESGGRHAGGRGKWFRVGCALTLLFCIWFWRKETSFHQKGVLEDITVQEVADSADGKKPLGSTIFAAPAPSVLARGGLYALSSGPDSSLKVFEDGRLMYRVNRLRDLDARAYVHLPDRVCFILSENSDPRTNGHEYTYRAPYYLRLRYQVVLGVLTFLSGVGLGAVGFSGRARITNVRFDSRSRSRLQTLLNSRPLLLLVACGAPFLFFLGRNAFFYPYRALLVSAGVLFLGALGVVVVLAILDRVVTRWVVRKYPTRVFRVRALFDAIWVGIACSVFVFLCGFAVGEDLSENFPGVSSILFCASVAGAVVVALALRWGVRVLNAFLFSFFVVTGATFLGGLVGKNQGQDVAAPLPGDPEIAFTTKPNIYLFLLESYAGSDALREFYGIDATPFYRNLADRGFRVRDTCSNQIFSVGSASSLMMMRHLDVEQWSAGLFDTQRGVRAMLCGADYNPVFDILKRNDYRISFLQRDYYLYPQPSPAVDATNLPFNSVSQNLQPLIDATGILAKKTLGNTQLRPLEQQNSEIRTAIEQALDQPRPTFHFIYTGLEHNRPREANAQSREQWKGEFRALRAEFNPRFLELLDFIEVRDPKALIVMIGDHGSKLFGHDFTIDSPGYPALAQAGLCTPETVARDQVSVLFAINTPVPHPVWENRVVTHVNLFRYLFATLSGDESLLERPEPDVGMVWTGGRYLIARDGRPLRQWEPIPPDLFPASASGDRPD